MLRTLFLLHRAFVEAKLRGRDETSGSLSSLDCEFDQPYADCGHPSIALERLIQASLIQILFWIRSERQLMEQMQYNLLFH